MDSEFAPPVVPRVGETTVLMTVELRGAEELPLTAPVGLGVAAGVVVSSAVVRAGVLAGYSCGSSVLTSDGSAWYHSGVLPALSEDASSAEKEALFVSASCRLSGGMAVRRTLATEAWTLDGC